MNERVPHPLATRRARIMMAAGLVVSIILVTLQAVPLLEDALYPPASGTVALVSDRDGNADIYLIDVVTGQLTNLTNTPNEDESDPAWSPDGEQLIFVSVHRADLEKSGLFTMNADGSNRKRLPFLGVNPAWSADGQRIFFSSFTSAYPSVRGSLFLVGDIGSDDLNGNNPQTLTSNTRTGYSNADSNPAVSPDGQFVLYEHNSSVDYSSIYRIDVDGHNAVQISPEYSKDAAWSPDGNQIAMFRWMSPEPMGLYIMDKDGKNWRLLDRGFIGNPTWSPDGRYVAYDAQFAQYLGINSWAIIVRRANGTRPALILSPRDSYDYYAPAWKPE